MNALHRPAPAKLLHWLFEASLAIKGALTSAEFLAGLGLMRRRTCGWRSSCSG